MKDFVAIDFETANNERSSVCSVGIVIVRNSAIAETFHSLIRPYPNYYNWFTQIHGISFDDTKDAPVFPDVWAEISHKLDGLPFVAHNSSFDAGCLEAVHDVYDMDYPNYTFYCTCQASRRVFGNILPNHKLPTVAKHCGYNLNNHHDALADATACAKIAMKIL